MKFSQPAWDDFQKKPDSCGEIIPGLPRSPQISLGLPAANATAPHALGMGDDTLRASLHPGSAA